MASLKFIINSILRYAIPTKKDNKRLKQFLKHSDFPPESHYYS